MVAAVTRGDAAFRTLVSVTEFSAWTGGKVKSSDPRVLPLLEGATQALRNYCRWHIAPVITETVTLDGPGGRLLQLDTLHVRDVTEVVADGVTLTPDEQYRWSALGSIQRVDWYWPDTYRSVRVSFEHGYDVADVPDVAQIIRQACAVALSSPMGATREQAASLAVTWATTAPGVAGGLSLLERDRELLAPYVRAV